MSTAKIPLKSYADSAGFDLYAYQKTSKNSNTQYKSKTKATQKQEIKIQQSNNSIIEEKEMGS